MAWMVAVLSWQCFGLRPHATLCKLGPSAELHGTWPDWPAPSRPHHRPPCSSVCRRRGSGTPSSVPRCRSAYACTSCPTSSWPPAPAAAILVAFPAQKPQFLNARRGLTARKTRNAHLNAEGRTRIHMVRAHIGKLMLSSNYGRQLDGIKIDEKSARLPPADVATCWNANFDPLARLCSTLFAPRCVKGMAASLARQHPATRTASGLG